MATTSASKKWALGGLLAVGLTSVALLDFVVGPAYVRELEAAERVARTAPAEPSLPVSRPTVPPSRLVAGAPVDSASAAPTSVAAASATASASAIALAAAERLTHGPPASTGEAASPAATLPAARPAAPALAARPTDAPIEMRPAFTDTNASLTVYFDTRSSMPTEASLKALWSLGQKVLASPGARLTVRGHADERGDEGFNQWLANRRAEVVASYLRSLGIAPSRLDVSGLGSSRPADPSGSEEALRRNRRVEIAWAK